jgi:branched-chain amino acid transport system ATP-binding protein
MLGTSLLERPEGKGTGAPELVVENLTVRYGKFVAVDDVSFSVAPASITALLGLNGAGKSSLLRGLTGLVPSEGRVAVAGTWLNGRGPHVRSRLGLALLPEGRGVFPNLTVEQNILAGVHRRTERATVLEEVCGLFPILASRRTQVAGTMSGGEQQMLSMARCIAARPSVMLLDEVSLGLSPLMVQQVYAKIAELRELGVAFLIVEQFAQTVLDVADDVQVMVRGQLLAQHSAKELAGFSADELGEILLTGESPRDDAPGTAVDGDAHPRIRSTRTTEG